MWTALTKVIDAYRYLRVVFKQLLGVEPAIRIDLNIDLEYHGDVGSGWKIASDRLKSDSVVIDVGIGENMSFSESLIRKYECVVYGFDPTPRAMQYVKGAGNRRFILQPAALGVKSGVAKFYLPSDERNVSGAIIYERHLKAEPIEVAMLSLEDICSMNGFDRIDLLKLDVEGAEYEIIESEAFGRKAEVIRQLCLEFHHRWPNIGRARTDAAVSRLRHLGFKCVWISRTSNEEYTFVREL